MLFLPAAALCCLCSALVAMAAELIQDDLTLTGRVGQYITFSCGLVEQCYPDYVLWWQKKETETFKKIVHFYGRDCKIKKDYGHPQEEDFLSKKTLSGCELKINRLKVDHSASYYCSCRRISLHSEK